MITPKLKALFISCLVKACITNVDEQLSSLAFITDGKSFWLQSAMQR